MRLRTIFVTVATAGLMAGPAFLHGVVSSVAGARDECTITGTAANDQINGTTQDDVICLKAGADAANGEEGNDVIRGGQGDDGGGPFTAPMRRTIVRGGFFGLNGDDGSDVIRGQADDDSMEGDGQNDHMYGGQGADCVGAECTFKQVSPVEPGNDFLKTKDGVSGNDRADGGANTDTCRIDAGDNVQNCEL
jgi:Ca2+-binding RTX toxin-like protein